MVSIQLGLLQYRHNGKKITLHVKMAVTEGESLHCVVSGDFPAQKLLNRNVTLIQKDHDNYLYIGGRISKEMRTDIVVLSLDLTKACWFIRKRKGGVTWLQEKYIYLPDEMMKMAS
jgi:hypothetical protein